MKINHEGNYFNDQIIDAEAKLSNRKFDKDLLISETFITWYMLIEGITSENFNENDLSNLLNRNYNIFESRFSTDPDFLFIIGWTMAIAFWCFGPNANEEMGKKMLMQAYKGDTKNSLFKWAVRQELGMHEKEVSNLRIDISARFNEFFPYGSFIEEYFMEIINVSVK